MTLRKVNNSTAENLHYTLMKVYSQQNPEKAKGQCRFMLFVRLRPGIASHFYNQSRTGYYPGNKYHDKDPDMLRGLIQMVDKELTIKKRFDRFIIYDNNKNGEEKEILKIVDDCIEKNALHLYSLMLTNYLLPQWLRI